MEKLDGDEWALTVKNEEHNHPASLHAIAHPMHRVVDFDTRAQIAHYSIARVPPR